MQLKQFAACLLAVCWIAATGCSAGSGNDESSGSGLGLGIEPAQEDEFGKATYEDGLYLSQEVLEPKPDPYADDRKKERDGTTDEGIRYTLYQEHAEITGHTDDFDAEELVIPETISGLPVTKIVSVPVSDTNKFEAENDGGFYSCFTACMRSEILHSTDVRICGKSKCRKALCISDGGLLQCAPRWFR